MQRNITIQEELKELAPKLPVLNGNMPFLLPEAYFDLLAMEILLKTTTVKQPNAVPENYFDQLADKVLEKIKQNSSIEEDIMPAVLQKISKKNVYSVPVGYFENIEIFKPTEDVNENNIAPVVPIKQNRKIWYRVAAACCIIGLFCTFGWKYFFSNTNSVVKSGSAINNADTIQTDSYSLAQQELAAAVAGLDDNSLKTELNQISTQDPDKHTAVSLLATDNFENAVKELSNEELEQYISESASQKS